MVPCQCPVRQARGLWRTGLGELGQSDFARAFACRASSFSHFSHNTELICPYCAGHFCARYTLNFSEAGNLCLFVHPLGLACASSAVDTQYWMNFVAFVEPCSLPLSLQCYCLIRFVFHLCKQFYINTHKQIIGCLHYVSIVSFKELTLAGTCKKSLYTI